MTQAQSYEAWRITYQSAEQAARNAFNTAEMLRQELLAARAAIPGPAHPAEGVPATATVPEAIDPGQCAQDVFDNGVSVGLFDIPKATANALCAAISAATGARLDWHYIAGRVHMKALATTQPAAQGLDALNLYYLQDARHHAMVGNCPSFWREGGGYTTNLDEAEHFTLEAAMKQHKCRETDLPWLCSEVDKLRRPTVDCQYMPRSWDAQRAALAAQAKQGGA